MCIFSPSLDSLILTHLLAWTLSSSFRGAALPEAVGLWGFTPVVSLPQAWRLCLFLKFSDLDKLSDYALSKGHRRRLSGCFQGVEGWGSLEVWGSKFFSG